jgi:hypothetical protein
MRRTGHLVQCAALAVFGHGATACHPESDPCIGTVCDISRGSCQRDAFEAIACAREYDGPSPPVEVIGFSEFKSRDHTPPATLREQQVANAFVLLGFAPTVGSLSESPGNPMAYYSMEEGRVTIVESTEDDEVRMIALLQAFANAQQDVDYDLRRLFGEASGSFDASLAMSAIVYGESHFSAAIAWANSFAVDEVSPGRVVGDVAARARELAADRGAPVPEVNGAFALGYGGNLYASRWRPRHGHRSEIAALLSNPAQTTLAVMSNEPPGVPAKEVADPLLDIEAPHQVIAQDTLGAWMARTFVLRAGGSANLDHWLGDRITIVGGETSGDLGVHWRIELGSFAAGLGEQIREASPSRPWFVHVTGGTLVIVAAFDPSTVDDWVERFGLTQ